MDPFRSTTSDGRAEKLLQKHFEGNLSPSEAEELLSYWDASPRFDTFARKNLEVEQYLRFFSDMEKKPVVCEIENESGVMEHVTLRPEGSPFSSKSPNLFDLDPLDLDELVRLEAEHHAVSIPKPETEAPPLATVKLPKNYYFRKESSVSRFGLVAIFLGVLLAGIAIYHEFRPTRPEGKQAGSAIPIARVTAVADPVFPEDAKNFRPGQQIGRDSIRLNSGLVELRLENEVRIVLEGPVVFDVRTPMKTFCRTGRVSVEVPKNASGFEVQTPLMNVRDIGTAFVVDASEEQCAVHVVKGEVEINRFVNGWMPLTEGLGMVAKPGNVLLQMLADASLFISELRMSDESSRYETRRHEAWKARRVAWADDPDLLLHLDFMEKNPAVTSQKCRTVPGRWAPKSAVAWSGKDDVVRLSIPRQRESFTLVASIWLYALSRSGNAILSVGDTSKGSFHWQVTGQGELQLLLGEQEQSILTNYTTPPVFSRQDTGAWFYVATTVDARKRTVCHYVDGKQVASHRWTGDISFDFTESQLGNWLHRDRSPTDRHFNGKIDEFILLGRAATPEEIRRLSQ